MKNDTTKDLTKLQASLFQLRDKLKDNDYVELAKELDFAANLYGSSSTSEFLGESWLALKNIYSQCQNRSILQDTFYLSEIIRESFAKAGQNLPKL